MTIKIHKWKCIQCEDKLFLRVDDQSEKDRNRLKKFEEYATKHVLKFGHEMTHKEKKETGFKRV